MEFGGQWRSKERARARRSELATVSSLRAGYRRERARKARVDTSALLGASPWTSCARWELMSGAIAGVRTTSGGQVAPWPSPTVSSASIQRKRRPTDRATLATDNSQTSPRQKMMQLTKLEFQSRSTTLSTRAKARSAGIERYRVCKIDRANWFRSKT